MGDWLCGQFVGEILGRMVCIRYDVKFQASFFLRCVIFVAIAVVFSRDGLYVII